MGHELIRAPFVCHTTAKFVSFEEPYMFSCTLKTTSKLHLAWLLQNVPLQFFDLDTELGDTDWVCEHRTYIVC